MVKVDFLLGLCLSIQINNVDVIAKYDYRVVSCKMSVLKK